ncbi:MAG: aminopeptidase P N-terminal domain-containing protein [Cyclobacteriaceae bacterium]
MHYIKILVLIIATGFASNILAQTDLPSDFLSKDFHKDRREKLRNKLPKNSVAVFFANPIRNRANDVDFFYHQDPNFYYMTGYKEPHAVLLVFKENQTAANGTSYNEIIFVQPRDAMREMWTGRRLGDEGVKNKLGLEQSFNNTEFKKYAVDFSKFDQVLFYDFIDDVRDNPADSSDLYSLIQEFKVKVNYPSMEQLIVKKEQIKNNLNTTALDVYMRELRGIKTKEELELISKAVRVSCQGQIEVMKAMRPGMSEREIQGVHEFVFKKYQAEDVGYPSIVGAGHNGCILHYQENYTPEISSKDLILMDLGAEYRGYTADITRTIPINGKFTEDQKVIYDIVLAAQEAAMAICKPGTTFAELTQVTRQVVNKGLKDLGIIKSENENHLYYPHGCCHHIGLDVHDKGLRDALQENMTITIEPGIYIPENSNCDPRWWGIAVRIEDDYQLTKDGYEHLSVYAPRTTEDIEATMKLPSPLDDFILPALKD